MEALLWLAVGVPALAALAVRVAPPGATRPVAVATASVGAVLSVLLLIAAAAAVQRETAVHWLPAVPSLHVGLQLDELSAVMSALVALVGLVVVVYAAGYFGDGDRPRPALAGLLAFLAAMQGLVLADGYLALLIFWELVGAASARLIAFNRDDERAPAGALRAFLTTRSADLGLYLALLALFATTGTLDFADERPDGPLGAVIGAGLVVAAMGKSAQVPLQTWLTGAMVGPTPVSALLHSATMVAAGVYLLARSHELLAGWPLQAAGWVGALTAVAGAATALAQSDLKRILAGSTTSQLGLMFVGLAAGGPAVAIFHLIAHALGKAGLFLAAGIFQHHRDSTALADLRGAGRDDRAALAGFAVCAMSIAAVPPLAAFWSKEHIAAASEHHPAWFVLVLLATAGAAAYLLRPALVLVASAPPRALHREGRTWMLAGLAGLALASVAAGALGPWLEELLAGRLPSSTLSLLLSLVALAAGGAALLAGPPLAAGVRRLAARELYVNELLHAAAERPLGAAAQATEAIDRGIDRLVDGVARGVLHASRAEDRFEQAGVDAAVDGLARTILTGGRQSTRIQSGRLHEYLRHTVLGLAAVGAVILATRLL